MSQSSTLNILEADIAVVVPCYNEEAAIAKVVEDFRDALPGAEIYVYDNNSTDRTGEAAAAAGAIVRREPLAGKGNVVRRMFADVEADIYIMVDGDDTYDAGAAPAMVDRLIEEQLDLVNGQRVTSIKKAYRPGHRFGNLLLTGLVAAIFGKRIDDMLSGYKVMSRRFVKSIPLLSSGFEIETELAVHALELRMPIAEMPVAYKDRPEGSESKLNTIKDGVRILRTILQLVKEERPLSFFTACGVLLAATALGLSLPVFLEYFETGLVPRLPTAVLSTGIMLLGFLSFACGLILDTVTRGRREARRMNYLNQPVFQPRVHKLLEKRLAG
ncbi:MAG: glycosyltransferase family 2 protein [Kiloniellales bacterium]|nr:glycosyltransferase family 2 protein [Kiloniellales bacterium]